MRQVRTGRSYLNLRVERFTGIAHYSIYLYRRGRYDYMTDVTLRKNLIRFAHERPEFRKDLLPSSRRGRSIRGGRPGGSRASMRMR